MSFPRYPKYKPSRVVGLGEVPSHWELKPLKHLAAIDSCGSYGVEAEEAEIALPVATTAQIDADGRFAVDRMPVRGFVPSEVQRFCCSDGDILVVKSSGSATNIISGKVGLVDQTTPPFVFSNFLMRVRPTNELATPKFIYALLRSRLTRQRVEQMCSTTTYPNLQVGEYCSAPLPIPPLPEQTAIAEFLDRETAKIDGLVAEQRRLMELLKEKRQAVISHAVTKGLNPRAPMKPSGIEWLGDVPEHWRVMPLGRVTISRCDGPFGSGLKSAHYTDTGVRVIRLQNIRRDGFDGTDEAFIDKGYYERELIGHDVVSGDVLIAGLGDDKNTVGRACVAPAGIEPAMVKADCFRYRLDVTQVLPEYIATELSASSTADAGVMSSGSTRSRIPLSMMATRKLAIPPLSEQKKIAGFISAEASTFDTLTAEAQRAIDLLQEHRTALISAAVTGQIDVRNVKCT